MWAPDEKNPKAAIPSRKFFLLSLSRLSSGLTDKFCLLLFPKSILWIAMKGLRLVSFLKSNFWFIYLIITASMVISFLARVLFLSFIIFWRYEERFFRPYFKGFSSHTTFKEWEMKIFRMKIRISPYHWGSSCPCPLLWMTWRGNHLSEDLAEMNQLNYDKAPFKYTNSW